MKRESLKTKVKKERGITLIALIITIVILIILSGVAIYFIFGRNGLVDTTEYAIRKTNEESAKEQVEIAIMGSIGKKGNIDNSLLKTNLEGIEQIENIPDVITDESYPFTVVVQNEKITIKADGTLIVGDWNPGNPNEDGFFTENSTINGKNPTAINPIIPAGFKAIDSETSSWKEESEGPSQKDVDCGLVITDGNSEFVWVPVYNVLAASEEEANENKAMAINIGDTSNPVYRGILYNFDYEGGSTVIKDSTTTETSNREPVNLVLDEDYEDFKEINLQKEYNLMVESVRKYGGFYIGRYETSTNENGIPQSKRNEMPINASQESNYMWYGLYNKVKEYSNNNKFSSITSGVIWGSQYDSMINWILKGEDKDKLLGGNIGNHNSTSAVETGTYENGKDKMNNIFDLDGNLFEWTMEAKDNDKRIARGGSYTIVRYAAHRLISNWYNIQPTATFDYYSTRIMFYVK